MKIPRRVSFKPAFSLMELMVAMAITAIIVLVLVSITSIAVDTWNRSRAELRAARQAKVMVDTMARDFESLVVRRGTTYQWLSATSPSTVPADPKLTSTNSSDLIFFCAPTDRYNGAYINNTSGSFPGDVSCVGYRSIYLDPLKFNGTFRTFVLKRYLSSPSVNSTLSSTDPHKGDDTFSNLLGSTSLGSNGGAFSTYLLNLETNPATNADYVCENVFQFVVTFNVEVMHNNSLTIVSVPVGQSSAQLTPSFSIMGNGIFTPFTPSGYTSAELQAGRVASVDISLTIITDAGMEQLRSPRPLSSTQQADFLTKNSFSYVKRVTVPGM